MSTDRRPGNARRHGTRSPLVTIGRKMPEAVAAIESARGRSRASAVLPRAKSVAPAEAPTNLGPRATPCYAPRRPNGFPLRVLSPPGNRTRAHRGRASQGRETPAPSARQRSNRRFHSQIRTGPDEVGTPGFRIPAGVCRTEFAGFPSPASRLLRHRQPYRLVQGLRPERRGNRRVAGRSAAKRAILSEISRRPSDRTRIDWPKPA